MAKSATKLQNIPVLVARKRLGAILERAKKNDERFVVSKKGEATAVILGYEDYLRSVLRLKEPTVVRNIRASARRSGASKISQDMIDSEIRSAREEKRTKRVS
jgi:prevent-host-death family protein